MSVFIWVHNGLLKMWSFGIWTLEQCMDRKIQYMLKNQSCWTICPEDFDINVFKTKRSARPCNIHTEFSKQQHPSPTCEHLVAYITKRQKVISYYVLQVNSKVKDSLKLSSMTDSSRFNGQVKVQILFWHKLMKLDQTQIYFTSCGLA